MSVVKVVPTSGSHCAYFCVAEGHQKVPIVSNFDNHLAFKGTGITVGTCVGRLKLNNGRTHSNMTAGEFDQLMLIHMSETCMIAFIKPKTKVERKLNDEFWVK